jgi:hypothetical protein
MQKLSGTSYGKNNNSCMSFHSETKKIEFDFSDFSTIFYAFYKNQLNGFTICDSLLQRGPWKVLDSYKYALTLRLSPWK